MRNSEKAILEFVCDVHDSESLDYEASLWAGGAIEYILGCKECRISEGSYPKVRIGPLLRLSGTECITARLTHPDGNRLEIPRLDSNN